MQSFHVCHLSVQVSMLFGIFITDWSGHDRRQQPKQTVLIQEGACRKIQGTGEYLFIGWVSCSVLYPHLNLRLLKFAVLKSWHIRGRLILRFPINIISRFPTQMLCFPAQIKIGTLCVNDHQVLRLEHSLELMEILKNLKEIFLFLKKNWGKKYIFIRGHLISRI